MAKGQMNRSGPTGGKGGKSQTTPGRTVRTTSYSKVAGKMRGDISQFNPGKTRGLPRQAGPNNGPMTTTNTQIERSGRTAMPMPPYNKNAGQPRGSQPSMKGSGSKHG